MKDKDFVVCVGCGARLRRDDQRKENAKTNEEASFQATKTMSR
jgi:hypothetical protein